MAAQRELEARESRATYLDSTLDQACKGDCDKIIEFETWIPALSPWPPNEEQAPVDKNQRPWQEGVPEAEVVLQSHPKGGEMSCF